MRSVELIRSLFDRYHQQYPDSSINLDVYRRMMEENRRETTQFLEFVRNLQAREPIYELAYQRLVHLYILGGSRAEFLSVLERRLSAAIAGHSALVLIEGVSGIGKTSLAMALEMQAEILGAAFIVGRCHDHGATPFWLWQDSVRSIEKQISTTAEVLPAPLGKATEAHSIQHLTQALGDWLMDCSSKRPLIIVLDDLHWADTDSLELLHQLVDYLSQYPILFIATYRSEETHHGHPLYSYLPLLHRNHTVDTIRLNPLTRADTAQLIAAYYGPCLPQLVDYLYQRSEGHPLFTVELLHDLADHGLLVRNNDGLWLPPDQSLPVPTLLQQVILRRVARLGNDCEKMLSHAAVVGETWQLTEVEWLVELPEDVVLDTLEQALEADLIVVEDEKTESYRFSHGLIREVLYKQHLIQRRKRIHARIAAYLEEQIPLNATRLAHHFYEAEVWDKALHYCLEAGEEAARNFANNRALDLYQKALDALQYDKSGTTAETTIDIYRRLGFVYRVLSQQAEADQAFRQMRDAAHSTGNAGAEAIALVNLVHVRIAQYRLDAAEKTAQETLRIAERLNDPQILTQAHGSLGKLLLIRGQLEASVDYLTYYQRHTAVPADYGTQSDMLRQQAYLAIWSGKYQEAAALGQQSLDCGMKSGNLLYITGGCQVLSASQIEAGKYVDAYHNIRSILDRTQLSDPHHHQLPRLLNQMGYLFLELGDASQALVWDQRALDASQANKGISRHEMKRYSLMNISTDLLYLGRIDEALDYAARFEAMTDAPDYAQFRYQNRYLLLMSELHLVQKKYSQAIELAQQARSFAESYGAWKNIAKSHWFEGQALLEIQQKSAVQPLQQAVRIADEIQHGSLRWKMRLSLGKALTSIGESAESIIQEAQALINQTAQTLTGSPLQESLKESDWIAQFDDLQRSPASEKPTYPAGLTQREVEILRLVASGATNQQIANTLTISPRTVNTHITNILSKTGCENRTAASAFAIKHNLLST